MKKKKITLVAVMLAALCVGAWLFVSPSIHRQADLEQREDLLDGIMAVMPAYIAVDTPIEIPAHEDGSADSEEGEPITEQAVGESLEPCEDYEDEPLSAAPPLEPLDPADFPGGITPIGILTIDSIDLRLPVMEGTSEAELRIAPGRVTETAQVGEIGNAVIAGHRNYTFGSMFNRVGEVENGDIIGFQAMNGQEMSFVVFEILVITPDNQITFIQPQTESIITLYSCTPIREATHRLVIRARKIEGGF